MLLFLNIIFFNSLSVRKNTELIYCNFWTSYMSKYLLSDADKTFSVYSVNFKTLWNVEILCEWFALMLTTLNTRRFI